MHSITGKLNKDAKQFQAGDSTGFGVRIGVKYRDPKTKEDAWTHYSAVIFAKSPNQIQFYQSMLVEGALVSIGAEQQKVDSFDGQNGQILSIDMLNARLTYAYNPNSQQAPQQGGYGQQAPQQQRQQQPAYNQQAPQQGNGYAQSPQQNANAQQTAASHSRQPAPNYGGFDDDIPM